ncbi:Uncharacterised protein [Candidatus Venteria ishoeyi]|uniref:Uncharacterized protein n=1 Tax=Candidatus Venteria ishoeyi TaxID=1899563 RepID=A0A1H6F8T4_9GAMM|nr:Uncharacterised protein [Candidatus Venteria ishoeyi]
MQFIKRERAHPEENLEEKYQILLVDFKAECERIKGESKHKKARALAVEFLNDWEAITRICP